MQKIKGFKEFMTYNDIKEHQVRTAAQYIKLRKCADGEVLFKQFDRAEKFYGVLKGEIAIKISSGEQLLKSMRQTKKMLVKPEFDEIVMEKSLNYSLGTEVISFKQGQCFGQWGLLEKKERTGSAVARGQSFLFEINKRGFEQSFKLALNRAEMSKKTFLVKILSPLGMVPQHKIDLVYKNLIPMVKN